MEAEKDNVKRGGDNERRKPVKKKGDKMTMKNDYILQIV